MKTTLALLVAILLLAACSREVGYECIDENEQVVECPE